MKYTENDYITAGFKFEKGKTPAENLRAMLEKETIEEQVEARRLIEQGRHEARLSHK
jgi:hypothetical protein